MKAMLVIEKDSIKHKVVEHLAPQGFVFIHYTNPLKAMDNIDEVAPEIVLFSAADYPRHWKPFLQLFRQGSDAEEKPFILLRGEHFDEEEGTKAGILGVNAIVKEDFANPEDLALLEDILARYAVWDDKRYDRRYVPSSKHDLEFMFTHPQSLRIITGRVEDFSAGGLLFLPEPGISLLDLQIGTTIDLCTLNVSGAYFEISAKIIHNSGPISFKFIDLPDDCRIALNELFEAERQEALKRHLS
ncbi:PilZ domain-containing protein [Sediminispirochaeta bajacaliforniensis]|uniref:PilZ domain-containing protein n=1 Tax=Sediminispirochaeta bajacaliforniensis TaxID=148 RepID=UPI00037E54BD|nr:PilZ domain-containing protein [Sediminispirochaeta bajacaliforniensis]